MRTREGVPLFVGLLRIDSSALTGGPFCAVFETLIGDAAARIDEGRRDGRDPEFELADD